MEKFAVYLFIFLTGGIITSKISGIDLPLYVPAAFFALSFILRGKLSIFTFFVSVFLLGMFLFKTQNEIQPYNNTFIGCRAVSVPYTTERFSVFKCYVFQSDKNEIIGRKLQVFLREKIDVFLGTDVYFLGRIYKNNASPYRNFIIINNENNPFFPIYRLKKFLIERYSEHSQDERAFNLGLALIFGEKGFLGDEKYRFINAGTSHLLAISGMHVGIILMILFFLLSFNKKFSYYVSLVFLVVYPFFTGLHIPVVRASILGILYIFSKIKQVKADPLNLLFFVGFIVALVSPESIFTVSFQLSFIAVFGILLYIKQIQMENTHPAVSYLLSSFLMSVIATVFTAPVVLYYFGKFSLTTIIATPVLVILLFPYLFLSVVNLFTAFSIKPAVNLMDLTGLLFLKINGFFADINFVHNGFNPSLLSVVMLIFTLFLVSFLKVGRVVKLSICVIAFFMFLSFSKAKLEKTKILVFEGRKEPNITVITPHGECFYTKINSRIRSIFDKNRCRRLFDLKEELSESVTQVQFNRKKRVLILNGKVIKIKNENYTIYPEK